MACEARHPYTPIECAFALVVAIAIVLLLAWFAFDCMHWHAFASVRIFPTHPTRVSGTPRLITFLAISRSVFVNHGLNEVPAHAEKTIKVRQKAIFTVVKNCVKKFTFLLRTQTL